MLTEEEIIEVEKYAKKSRAIEKLLEFWHSSQVDGESAIRIALNNKWLEFADSIKDVNVPLSNHEKNEVLNSLIDITKLWKGIEKEKNKKSADVPEELETPGQSVADRMANRKRKEA